MRAGAAGAATSVDIVRLPLAGFAESDGDKDLIVSEVLSFANQFRAPDRLSAHA